MSTEFHTAIYCPRDAPWPDVQAAEVPVFTSPILRPRWKRAAVRTAAAPVKAARALRHGLSPRDVLAYMVWLDSAHFFRVRKVQDFAGNPFPLPARRRRRAARERPNRDSRIGVFMIAQNDEGRIGRALESVRSLADELVVVDGGSQDGTSEVARSFGATVIERPFDENFSAQFNFGIDNLHMPWRLQIDTDEALAPGLADLLRHVAVNSDAEVVFLPFLNLLDEESVPRAYEWPCLVPRLFRAGIRYDGRPVHPRFPGWSRGLYLPISGPYVVHRKTRLRSLRSALLYDRIDPTQYDAGQLRWVRQEIARLEGGDVQP